MRRRKAKQVTGHRLAALASRTNRMAIFMGKMCEFRIFHPFLRSCCFGSDRPLTGTDYFDLAQTRRQRQWGQENGQFGAMESACLTGRRGIAAMECRSGGWGWHGRYKSRSNGERRCDVADPLVSHFVSRRGRAMPRGTGAMDGPVGEPAKGMDMSADSFERTLPAIRLSDVVAVIFRELTCRFRRTGRVPMRPRLGDAPAAFPSGVGGKPAVTFDAPRRIRVRALASFDELACMEAWEWSANDP